MVNFLVLALLCACNKQTSVIEPMEYERTETATKETELPEYMPPGDAENLIPVSEGEPALFSGYLIDEIGAFSVAEMRINYDQVYWLAVKQRLFLLSVIRIQEEGLQKADRQIGKLEVELYEIRSSWWAQNKFVVGIGFGLFLGMALSISAGRVWSEMDE